jgi:hypothetical protein
MVFRTPTSRNRPEADGATAMGPFDVDWSMAAIVLAGALAGGFVNGLTGFGTGLTALPLWLLALEPPVAAQLVSAASVAGHIFTLPATRHAIDWRQLAPMLVAGLIGVPIGIWALPMISLAAFKLTIGCVLIAYCAFMLAAAGRVTLAWGGRGAEAAIGLAGGVLGGLAGLSGALPTVWAALKGWSKEKRRIVFQTFNTTVLSAMLVGCLLQGLIGQRFLLALALALPGTLMGSRLGLLVYRRLDDHRFDRIVLLVLLLSGMALVWWSF